jgi:glyoxylase I family protein
MMPKQVHHLALWVHEHEVEDSLRFYRDGIGLDMIMDIHAHGDFAELFDVPYRRLRSIMLGDRGDILAGVFELVVFDHRSDALAPVDDSQLPEPSRPSRYLLHSFFVEFDEVLPRLKELGFLDSYKEQQVQTPVGLSRVITLRDPHGFMVELADRQVATLLLEESMNAIKAAETR